MRAAARIHKAKARQRMASFARTRRGPGMGKAESRSKALAWKVKKIFDRYLRSLVDEDIQRTTGVVKKSEADKQRFIEQLAQAIAISGIREVEDAGKRADPEFKVGSDFYRQFYEQKRESATAMLKETDREFREKMRQFLSQWLTEDPGITHAELARRIRFSFYADGADVLAPGQKPTRGILEPLERGPRITRDVFGRASLVARTEMAMAQNTGSIESIKASGLEYKMWISQKSNGGRGHQEMNGEVVPVGEDFELPDGTRMAYPGDPSGPIKHLANCRCSVVAAPPRRARAYERKHGITPRG
jgi:hypothetical protein